VNRGEVLLWSIDVKHGLCQVFSDLHTPFFREIETSRWWLWSVLYSGIWHRVIWESFADVRRNIDEGLPDYTASHLRNRYLLLRTKEFSCRVLCEYIFFTEEYYQEWQWLRFSLPCWRKEMWQWHILLHIYVILSFSTVFFLIATFALFYLIYWGQIISSRCSLVLHYCNHICTESSLLGCGAV
jgi:hypothetical protein